MKTKSIIALIFLMVSCQQYFASAATISGTLFKGDQQETISDIEHVMVTMNDFPLSSGNCQGWCNENAYPQATINNDGTYIFQYVQPGQYIISASAKNGGNYLTEYWASPGSVRNVEDAQVVIVNDSGDEILDKDFNLDPGGTISGTIFKADGLSLLNDRIVGVRIISDSNTVPVARENIIMSNSNYIIPAIPTGHYYLQAYVYGSANINDISYAQEWWASSESVEKLSSAEQIFINEGENLINRNFQLDPIMSIRGKIFYKDGLAISPNNNQDVKIIALDGKCNISDKQIQTGNTNGDGEYVIHSLKVGTYFLIAVPLNHSRFTPVWWNNLEGTTNCNNADSIILDGTKNIFDKNFKINFQKPFPWDLILPAFRQVK